MWPKIKKLLLLGLNQAFYDRETYIFSADFCASNPLRKSSRDIFGLVKNNVACIAPASKLTFYYTLRYVMLIDKRMQSFSSKTRKNY